MTREINPHQSDKEKTTRFGHHTKVTLTFVRHSQKQSGLLYTDAGPASLSISGLSATGKARAGEFGKIRLAGRTIKRAYATSYERTQETLASALEAAKVKTKILQPSDHQKSFFTLPEGSESNLIALEYKQRFQREQEKLVAQFHPGKKFTELTPDQQEEIAETAEEPVLEWYLSFGDKRPDPQTPSTREHAASVAFKINRLINLTDSMPNGHSVDLISCGHKTSTEAFLKYAIVQRNPDGSTKTGFDNLDEIGGSLHILDSWDLTVENDHNGQKSVSLTLRRENGESRQYGLDLNLIKQLATEHQAPLSP